MRIMLIRACNKCNFHPIYMREKKKVEFFSLGLSKKCNHLNIRQIKFPRVIGFENFNPFMGWL